MAPSRNSQKDPHPAALASPDSSNAVIASTTAPAQRPWAHTPSRLTLLWLGISIPLVIWDTGYVVLRPLSMPGGALHWPLWVPYELYGNVDHVYGWKAWNANNGFTAAQGSLNIVETLMYIYYVYLVLVNGHMTEVPVKGRGAPGGGSGLSRARVVEGPDGGVACLVLFAAAIMTLSKTLLYWLNEYYSGFDNIGHNTAIDLLFLWIIPNGAWLVFSGYMAYVGGSEILEGLATASRTVTGAEAKRLADLNDEFKKKMDAIKAD